jgi:hypothetical protein
MAHGPQRQPHVAVAGHDLERAEQLGRGPSDRRNRQRRDLRRLRAADREVEDRAINPSPRLLKHDDTHLMERERQQPLVVVAKPLGRT